MLVRVIGLLIVTTGAALAGEPASTFLENSLPELREFVGHPLLDTVIGYNNDRALILERITPQGALFFFSPPNEKKPGENFDELRKRAVISISIATCSGTKDLNGKVSNVTVWETWNGAAASYSAIHLQRLLQMMNSPSSITTPSTMRAPRTAEFGGVVIEYVRGDTTEDLSVLDDKTEPDARIALRANWQIQNTSFCPKS